MTETILEEAQRLIHGDRNKNYGHPRDNFADIAALFSSYLGTEITDIDVANLMILVKIARVKGTGYHRDSFTDIAGYAGCVERIYEEPDPSVIAMEQITKDFGLDKQPRVWASIAQVPTDVRVQDRDGDYWYTDEDHRLLFGGAQGDGAAPPRFMDNSDEIDATDKYYGPFTEVL